MKAGFVPLVVGRRLRSSLPVKRPYPVRRLRLLFTTGPLFYGSINIRLFVFILFAKADILLANDLDTLPAVWLAAKLKRIPFVFDSHEYFTEVPELIHRPFVQSIWKFIEQLLLPHVEHMLTVNQEIADLFAQEYSLAPEVVMNVPLAGNESQNSSSVVLPEGAVGKTRILYQGAVNMGRGLEEMICALPFLPECFLIIAGDGDLVHKLQDLVSEKQVAEQVYFTGRLPFDQLRSLTKQADIGISLEQDLGLNYRLALPNKIFDYMQAGIPVLSSSLPVMSALVSREKIGLVISSFDPDSIRKAIHQLWPGKPLHMECSKNAKEAGLRYVWENQEERFLAVFDRALSDKN